MKIPQKFRHLLRGSSQAFIVRIVGVLLLFGFESSLAKWLGAEQFGEFSFARTVFMATVIIVLCGVHTGSIKFSSIYIGESRWSLFRGYIRWAHLVVIGNSLLMLACFTWLLTATETIANAGLRQTMLVGMWLIPVVSLSFLRQSILRGMDYVVIANIPIQIITPVCALAFSFLVVQRQQLTSESAMVAFVLANLIGMLAGFYWLRKRMPRKALQASAEYRKRSWFTTAVPMLFFDLSRDLVSKADIFLLGWLANMTAVGLFTVPLRIATLAKLPMSVVDMVIAPTIAREYSQGNTSNLQSTITFTTIVLVVVSIAVSLPILIWSEYLLSFFGGEFLQSKFALNLLIAANIVSAAAGPSLVLLLMTGHQTFVVKSMTGFILLDIVLNFYLIPRYGFEGAAITASITLVASNITFSIACKKLLGIVPWLRFGKSLKTDTIG